MKRAYVLILIMGAILLVIWVLRRPSGQSIPIPVAKSIDPRPTGSPAAASTMADTSNIEPDDGLKHLGLPLAPEVRPYLQRAMHCAEYVELEKRRFPPESSAYWSLAGLMEKLFRDDYAYAALATGQLDALEAWTAAEKVGDYLLTNENLTLPEIGAVPLPALAGAAHGKFVEYYQPFLSPVNPEYFEVYGVLHASTTQDVLADDLLKDACLYVGLRTQLNESKNEDETFARTQLEDLMRQISDPAQLAAATNSLLEVTRQKAVECEQLETAYRNIFTFRFEDRHGVNSETLFPQLERLALGTVGPSLRVPE